MSVLSVIELPAVSATQKFGEAPKFQRKWVVEVNDPLTTQSEILNSVGVSFLTPHPEAGYVLAMTANVTNYNSSRWHYEVSWDYELPKQENADKNPLARPDIWKWSTGGLQVPALYYYDGSTVKPLQNSANDFFEGATVDISTLQASISGNRATFDYAMAQAVSNSVNSDTYLGAPPGTWKCGGISAQPTVEVVDDQELRFWQVEVTLEYRPDKWSLQLPNVGWNYLDGSTKKRVYVIDPDTGERVPSSNPQPLNSDGTLKTGAPDIVERRVQREVAFNEYFGQPTQE
jgi:hypothetical protein